MQTFRTYTTLPYTIPLTPLVSVYFHLLGLLVYSYEYMLSANYFVYNESITPPQHSPTHPSGICLFPSLRSSMPTRTSTCSLQTEFIYNGPNMQTFSIYTTLPYTIPLTPSVSVYFHLLGLLRLLVRVHALCKLLRLQRAKHADLPGGAAIRTADVEHGVYLCHPRRGAPATLT